MRILKVAQSYYPFLAEGGRPDKVWKLSRKLAERGHRVTVLTADLGLGKADIPPVTVEKNAWGWRAQQDGVEAIYLRTRARYRALTWNPGILGFCRASLKSFDVVHIYGLYDLFGPCLGFFCRRRRIPYLVEPLGMSRPIDRSFRLKRFWHRAFGNRLCGQASRLIATSELERQQLLEDGFAPKKILLRYNGIDLDEFASLPPKGSFRSRWRISAGEPVVLFLGRIIPRKGADRLIEAFAEACPGAGRLVIAGPEGENGCLRTLHALARRHGVETRVIFPGPLYGDAKRAALADADVFALPSRYENFGNAPAEAIACQVPVIVTQTCGISPLVSGKAGIVIPVDGAALTEALRELLNNRLLYEHLKSGCRQVTRSLGWDQLAEQMEKYYAEVLAQTSTDE